MLDLKIDSKKNGIRAFDLKHLVKIGSINYLNLEISYHQKTLININSHSLNCNFSNIYKHELHGSNSQLNSLIDLIINLGESLNYYQNKLNLILEKDLKDRKERFEDIKSILTYKKPKNKNHDFIKDQNSVILEELAELQTDYIRGLKIIKEEVAHIKKFN